MSPVSPLPQWIAANPEPDPQALAERYGGYSRVPVEEWSRLDRLILDWQRRYSARALPVLGKVMEDQPGYLAKACRSRTS
jgi:hypothetical protein